ncbi:MAG: apolipoprotein N-acyltransferase [Pseudomonadota bacterium]
MTAQASASATSRLRRTGLALLVGAAAALGQAPFDLLPLSLIGFAGLLWLAYRESRGRAVLSVIFWSGTAYFGVALHWIVEPFLVDIARHGWMAPFALILIASGMALFWVVFAAAILKVLPQGATSRGLVLATALTAAEVARASFFTGFPWAHPGHILIDTRYLALAPLIGPHGMTLFVLLVAACLAVLAQSLRGAVIASFLVVGLWAPFLPGPVAEPPDPARPIVRLIQPNAPQDLKWDLDWMPVFFQRAIDMTAAAPEAELGPELIVWPETSLPELLSRSEISRTSIALASGGTPVLVGAQDIDAQGARNLAALLGGEGEVLARVEKHHLVPFGEYIPLGQLTAALGIDGLADIIGGGFAAGEGPQTIAFGEGIGQGMVMICYEAIFPQYVRQIERPDWLIHLTNDAWFGGFSGPFQHLALARLRAAEQGLPVLRAANTGVSAVIDPRGQIQAALALGETGYLDVHLPAALPATPYSRTGDWPALAALALLLIGGVLRGRMAGLAKRH